MFQKSYLNFAFSLVSVLITYLFCSYFNRVGMQSFYAQIQKSVLTPPNYVFPIVWTVLYVLIMMAFDLILNIRNKNIMSVVWQFLANLTLQILWTYLFFHQAQFSGGLFVLVALDIATIILIRQAYVLSPTSAYLLIPYMLWLLFATYLNWAVVSLN